MVGKRKRQDFVNHNVFLWASWKPRLRMNVIRKLAVCISIDTWTKYAECLTLKEKNSENIRQCEAIKKSMVRKMKQSNLPKWLTFDTLDVESRIHRFMRLIRAINLLEPLLVKQFLMHGDCLFEKEKHRPSIFKHMIMSILKDIYVKPNMVLKELRLMILCAVNVIDGLSHKKQSTACTNWMLRLKKK